MSMPPHFMSSMTLKALLEDPNLKNPPIINQSSSNIKVKKENGNGDVPQFNYGSAFLGPNLWNKTYATSDFNLEYMDLDEFLNENDVPEAMNPDVKAKSQELVLNDGSLSSNPASVNPVSPRQFLNTPPPLLSPDQSYVKTVVPSPNPIYSPSSPNAIYSQSHNSPKSPSPPVSPFHVEFQVTEQDLQLTSVPDYDSEYPEPAWRPNGNGRPPNGNNFDPRKRNFSEEELKPQPIIKKSKKVFVPEDLKDDRYWARRHKNNFAAKRSRDARRVKENQIALRAAYLEKENTCLKEEMMKLRKENVKLKEKVSTYEEGEDPTLLSLTAP